MPASAPIGARQIVDDDEVCLFDPLNDKLGYPIATSDLRNLLTIMVDQVDKDLAPVPSVHRARCVEDSHTLLGGKTRPRMNQADVALGESDAHYDLVWVGIGLYDRAMTLQTEVINVKRVPAGTGVSYHHTHVTPAATTLALVPLGYADGIPRSAGQKASVLLGGVRCPIVGRIAMDQFVVDAGDLPVEIGAPVVVFGPGEQGEPTVAEWAAWADTIPHEILTGVGARVHRRYL